MIRSASARGGAPVKKRRRRSLKDLAIESVIGCMLLLITFICLFPFLFVINNSISDSRLVIGQEIFLIPRGIHFRAYQTVLQSRSLLVSYGNTIFYTVVGTALGTLITLLCAYPLSRPKFVLRHSLSVFTLITMYFSGGMVPTFIMMNKYGLYNTRWAIILPAAFSCYNMIVARTYIQSIGEEIIEAAAIEGANDLQIFFRIIIQLSKPIIAVISLYNAVYMWNVYFNAILYLPSADLQPLQVFLNRMMTTSQMGAQSTGAGTQSVLGLDSSMTLEQVKYAAIVITVVPILFVYPFVQRYFVKGVMLGSLKS